MRQPDGRSHPCQKCSACRTFNFLKRCLRSAAGFFFPLPTSQDSLEQLQKFHGHTRSTSALWSSGGGRMGSTRPTRGFRRGGDGFIHAGFKSAVILPKGKPSSRRTPHPLTLSSSAHSLAHSSSNSPPPLSAPVSTTHSMVPTFTYSQALSSSVHSLVPPTMGHTPAPSSPAQSVVPSSAYPLAQSTSACSLALSSSPQSLAPSSSTHSLASTMSTHTLVPSSSRQSSDASSSVDSLTPLPSERFQVTPSSGRSLVPSASTHFLLPTFSSPFLPLSRSTSNLTRGWRDFKQLVMREKKPETNPNLETKDSVTSQTTKDDKETKGTSGVSKNKSKGRRDRLRRFTTSVLPSQLKGLVQQSSGVSSTDTHPLRNPAGVDDDTRATKMQRLSERSNESETPQVNSVNPTVSRKDQGNRVQFENPCISVSKASSNSAPPKPPRIFGTGVLKNALPVVQEKPPLPSSGSSHSSRSYSVSGDRPPAKRTLGHQKSASCSYVKKPVPAPRTIFPTFTTPISRKGTFFFSKQGNNSNEKGAQDARTKCSTPLIPSKFSVHCPSLKNAKLGSVGIRSHMPQVNDVDSCADDSYTSHKCYLTPSRAPGDSMAFTGPSVDNEDIPWITTPLQYKLKGSRSMYNLNLGGCGPRTSPRFKIPYPYRMLLSYRDTKENEVSSGVDERYTLVFVPELCNVT